MMWPRVIAHADMDAFFAAVEQLDRPELRGRPVLVGGTGRRGVVSTASYEARPFGVGSAMPMALARRRCPQAVVLPPRFERYHELSLRIMEVFGRFSPRVEALSLDEAFMDLTGTERLLGTPAEIGRAIKEQVREATGGLTVSVGIAPTKFVAKVASDFHKPDGLVLVPEPEVRAFLEPLPIARLWGVGKRTEPELRRLGLRTLGDVARAQSSWLERRLGAFGLELQRLALGDDPRPVEPERDRKSLGAEWTLEQDVVGEAQIVPHLRRAAARVARGLRDERLVASGVRLKLKTKEFRLLTRQLLLAEATDDERLLFAAAQGLLRELAPTTPMRLVGLAAYGLAPELQPRQPSLFPDRARERARKLDRTLDALQDRFGAHVVRRGGE